MSEEDEDKPGYEIESVNASRAVKTVKKYDGQISVEEGVIIGAKKYTFLALRTLAEICENGRSEAARASAATQLLILGHGRPPVRRDHAENVQPNTKIEINFTKSSKAPPTITLPEPDYDEES